MKPFNLEEAKAGKPICTRNGDKARIICTDLMGGNYHIVAAVRNSRCEEVEDVRKYTSEGKYTKEFESDLDLFMAEDKESKCPFKPFDKVLVRNSIIQNWKIDLFERYMPKEYGYNFVCFKYDYKQCIPYNEETEHLIGTTDAPPEKYVIW